MTNTNPNAFPYVPQSAYVDIPTGLDIGDVWSSDFLNDIIGSGLIAATAQVAAVYTLTVTANSGDSFGVAIDGATYIATSTAANDTSAEALRLVLVGAAALTDVVASVTRAANVLTLTFANFADHTVAPYSPATADVAVAETSAAAARARLDFGFAVVRDSTVTLASSTAIREPSAINQEVVGILYRTVGSRGSLESILQRGDDPDFLASAQAYPLALQRLGVVVEYTGTAPQPGDDVFVTMVGAGAGRLWRRDSGAVSQVTIGTLVANDGDTVGLAIQGLPNITVSSTADATATATLLVNAINGNAQAAAIVVASSAAAVITLTFRDGTTRTVSAVSPATADITGIDNTTLAVAATAKQLPNASWGAVSSSDVTPTRAFLRVDVRGN